MFESLLKRPFWQSLFTGTTGSGRTKFTFEELRALSDVLNKNQVVTEANKAVVVETIRSIAEFMIWGDQNEPRIFEYFMENNVMHYLHRVLQQPANRSGDVAKQVLQTLSIIIQNIRSENGTYFLFSNNHINNIVEIRFDFDDEEVLGYYISFLKTISLKLNAGTVQFFFDRRESAYTFPLYSEAVKFAHHKEGMVRAGVRTLTLNVYSVRDPHIQEYVCRPPATSYIAEMVSYIADQVKILDKRMASAEGFSAQVLSSLDSQLAEVEDMVSYVSDILTTAHPRFAHLTAEQLWVSLVGPYLFRPLLEYGTSKAAGQSPQGPRRTSAGGAAPASSGAAIPLIRAACSLYCLERLFVLITYPPLLNNLALALLDPRVGHPSCRPALVALLRAEDHRAVPAALRCLVAVVHNRHMAPELLALLGLVPRLRTADLHTACSIGECAACNLRDQLPALPAGCSAAGMGPDPLAEEAQPVATVAAGTNAVGPAGGAGGVPAFGYHVVWTRLEGPSQASPEREDYGAGYPSEAGDTGVDPSLSSFSEAAAGTAAPRQGPGDGQPQEGEEEQEPLEAGVGAVSQAESQADLLGLSLDAGGGEPTAGPVVALAEAPVAQQDSSLPIMLEVSLDTPLEVQYSASDTSRGTGPSVGDLPAAESGQLGGSGFLTLPQPASPAPQQQQQQPLEHDLHNFGAQETQGFATDAAVARTQPNATSSSGDLLLDAPVVSALASSAMQPTADAAAARAPETRSDNLTDLLAGPSLATAPSDAPAAQPAPSSSGTPVPLASVDSTRSLAAAASGSLLDSLLEPGAGQASGGLEELSTRQQLVVDQVKTPSADIGTLIDVAQDVPSTPTQSGSGAPGDVSAVEPPHLLDLDGVQPGTSGQGDASSGQLGPGAGAAVSGSGELLDLLDAPLQPAGPSGGAAAAAAAEVAVPADRINPLEDLLGVSAVEPAGVEVAATGAETSMVVGPPDSPEDLLGLSVGGAEASSTAGAEAATDREVAGAAVEPSVTSASDMPTPVVETPSHAVGSAGADLLDMAELDAEPPAPPPPPPAPPLPPPAAPPPVAAFPPCPTHARPAAVAATSDILDALFALLSMQLLPVAGLWNIVLLLGQLYPRADELRELARQLAQQPQQPLPVSSQPSSVADQLADLLGVGEVADGAAGQDPGTLSGSAVTAAPGPSPPAAEAPVPVLRASLEQQPHPLDPSSTVGWACELSGSQREALRVAAVSAASAVLDEVGGMWCDALVAMLALEWPAAHDAVTRPTLRTGAEQLMAGPHLYPRQHPRALSGASRNDQGLSGSAVAALHSYHAVSRLVALLLLHDILQKGSTTRQPPATCPVPPGGDVEGRDTDVLEGQEVELQAGSAIPCIVSFSPGQERRVYFAAAGPALRRLADYLHNPQGLLVDPTSQAVVLHSSPAVVLADPAPTRLNAGIVLSVSPLMGSDPSVDKNVAKWLHVHVRPSVRGLLRLLRSAASGRKGGLLGALRHLVDGHWVLAFPDAERAGNARQLVEQSAHRLRALYCELLSPLLSTVME